MWFVWFLLGAIVSVAANFILSIGRSTSGVLRIDHSNPEKDSYRFEISDLDSLSRKKKIVLKIDNYADLSQN